MFHHIRFDLERTRKGVTASVYTTQVNAKRYNKNQEIIFEKMLILKQRENGKKFHKTTCNINLKRTTS